MKNRVFVYDVSQNLISKYLEKMEKFLVSKGLFDFSFLASNDFDEFEKCVSKTRENGSTFVVVCDNDKLDKILEIVKEDGDELELLDEQAIKLENVSRGDKMLFVPFELDFERFLLDFLPTQQTQVFSLFGKSRKYVEDQFKMIADGCGCSYAIITKHAFLHTAYCSVEVEYGKVAEIFGEALYSQKDETLAENLLNLLAKNGQKLATVEYGTCGKLGAILDCDGEVVRGEDALEGMGLTQGTLVSENAGKEVVFALSKRGLESANSDVVLSVCDRFGGSNRSYISVGDRQIVHLYSSVFSDDIKERHEVLCDFAIFRMMCFLKNQNT